MNRPLTGLKEIEDYWAQFPGAAPGGTGSTGLASSDAQGWSDLLNLQTEHLRLKDEQAGKPPPIISAVDNSSPSLGLTTYGTPAGQIPPETPDPVLALRKSFRTGH